MTVTSVFHPRLQDNSLKIMTIYRLFVKQYFERLSNPKMAPWIIGVIKAHWAGVRYPPAPQLPFFRNDLACSSDQKKTDCRQNASMMLASASDAKSTSGIKIRGEASG